MIPAGASLEAPVRLRPGIRPLGWHVGKAVAATDRDELYNETLLEHGRSPRARGRLADATHAARGSNPLCGDVVTLELFAPDDEQIVSAGFEAEGCAILIASASLLVSAVRDRSLSDARALVGAVDRLLADAELAPDDSLGELAALAAVRAYPARLKCALLPLRALDHALADIEAEATTE